MTTYEISTGEVQAAARTLGQDAPTLLAAASSLRGAGSRSVGATDGFPRLGEAARRFAQLHAAALTTAAGAAQSYAADLDGAAVLAQQTDEDVRGLFGSMGAA